jgi:hypothetical protein
VVLSTLGISGVLKWNPMVFKLLKRFFFFHPCFITIVCDENILNFEFLDFLQVVFKTTGNFVTLTLLSVGLQFAFEKKKSALALLGLGLLYKLLTPALIYVLYVTFAAAFKSDPSCSTRI